MKSLIFIALLALAGAGLLGEIDRQDAIESYHLAVCEWDCCDMLASCEEGTDGYYVYRTHIEHPRWSYEQCMDYIFSPENYPTNGSK